MVVTSPETAKNTVIAVCVRAKKLKGQSADGWRYTEEEPDANLNRKKKKLRQRTVTV